MGILISFSSLFLLIVCFFFGGGLIINPLVIYELKNILFVLIFK